MLFIDEIHRIARPAEELLYMAMEDFRVDVIVGKGPGRHRDPARPRRRSRSSAPPPGPACSPARCATGSASPATWTSTTRPSSSRCCGRSAELLGVDLRADGAAEIAGRSRGTPRIANRLLRRVRDYAEVRADGVVTEAIARAALAVYDVDELGLDRLDRAVLDALVRRFGGGPVGVGTLAVAVGEEVETVEEVAEPFLVRAGLLARTPRGRVATPAAWAHLGPGAAAPARTGGSDAVRRVGSARPAVDAGIIRRELLPLLVFVRRRPRPARVLRPGPPPAGRRRGRAGRRRSPSAAR